MSTSTVSHKQVSVHSRTDLDVVNDNLHVPVGYRSRAHKEANALSSNSRMQIRSARGRECNNQGHISGRSQSATPRAGRAAI